MKLRKNKEIENKKRTETTMNLFTLTEDQRFYFSELNFFGLSVANAKVR